MINKSDTKSLDAFELAACLKWAEELLASASSRLPPGESPRLDAEVILADILQKNRTWLRVWPDYILNKQQRLQFEQATLRRLKGEPVAYIMGSKEFWSLNFKVTPDTLIPRPDTEVLVETALSLLPQEQLLKIADLGTGTGAIAIAIASERPKTQVYALDYSQQAVDIASFNQESLKVTNVQCLQGNWLAGWQHGALDMIVSNPPYVAPGDPHLDDLSFEPYQALVAGDRGFADYKIIIEQAALYLKTSGWLLFEHGFEQASELSKLLSENGFSEIRTVKDYAGHSRVTLGQFKQTD